MRECYHQIYNIIFSKLVLLPTYPSSFNCPFRPGSLATVCMVTCTIFGFQLLCLNTVCLLALTSFALKLMFFNLSPCTVSRAVCALHTDQCRLICIKKFLRLGICEKTSLVSVVPRS